MSIKKPFKTTNQQKGSGEREAINQKPKERGKKKSTELRLKKKTIGLNYFRETSLFLIKFFKSFKK